MDAGTDVNAKDEDENTPLHRAAYYGHKEIVVLLIAKGADVNVKNDVGYTPLDWNHPDSEMIHRLLEGSKKNDYKLRDLMVSIIADESFTKR